MPYSEPCASSLTWVLDGGASATGSPPFPSTVGGVPSNYYIVVDDITVTLTANGAGSYGVDVDTDDAFLMMSIGKTFAAAETDTFHLVFPRGLPIPKITRTILSNGRFSVQSNAVYTNSAIFTVTGSPTSCQVTVNFRYMSPADLGT